MKQIPMCWKCTSAIIEKGDIPGSLTMAGCKECAEIKDWEDAKELCPLLKEK